MAHPNAINAFFAAIAQWFVGEPFVFYQAGFADAQMNPIIDEYDLGPLQHTMSTNISAGAVSTAWVPPGKSAPNGGMRLTLSRPTGLAENVTINAGLVILNPLPRDANVLIVRATFLDLNGPHGAKDAWGSVVLAREDGIPDEARSLTAVRVALQRACRETDLVEPLRCLLRGVRMVAPRGEPNSGDWFPDGVYKELFETSPFDDGISFVDYSVFGLDLLVDRWGGPAVASVQTFSYSQSLTFVHLELASINNLTAAGVNVAIPSGNGPAAVTVRDFQMIGMKSKPWTSLPIIRSLAVWLLGVSAFRRLRARMIHLAFRTLSPKP